MFRTGGGYSLAATPDYTASTPGGNSATVNNQSDPVGSIAIGDNAKVDNEDPSLVSIAIGRDSHVKNLINGLAKKYAFAASGITSSNTSGGIAMGFNSYATTGSIDIGNKTYRGTMGGLADLNSDSDSDTDRQSNLFNMTTVGNNSYNKGLFATMFGAYNIATSDYDNAADTYLNQNFGASVIGSLNSIRSKGSNLASAGIASSIVGTANIIEKSNGALIFGAGNTLKNSYQEITLPDSFDNVDDLVEKLKQPLSSGGATTIIGGGNTTDYTLLSNIIGVNNTLTGTQDNAALGNFITGFKNTGSNIANTTLIGSQSTARDGSRNIVLGDNRTVIGNDIIALGSVDNGNGNNTAKTSQVSGSVAIGHNAVVTAYKDADSKGAGVALGENSVANTQKGQEGYDIAAGIAGLAALDKSTSTWKATADAVSVGDTGNTGNTGNAITRQITGVAAGTADTDAVNVAQLKRLADSLSNQISSITPVEVKGDEKNINVAAKTESGKTTYTVSLKKDIQVSNSVDVGGKVNISKNNGVNVANTVTINEKGVSVKNGPSVTTSGVNAGNKRITNVADGKNPTDAVNVRQLRQATQDVTKLRNDVTRLNKEVKSVRNEMRGIGASAAAAMGLPQVMTAGKSMLAASVGVYKGESSVAIGWSKASDNGKRVFKIAGAVNSNGDMPVGAGFGYQY